MLKGYKTHTHTKEDIKVEVRRSSLPIKYEKCSHGVQNCSVLKQNKNPNRRTMINLDKLMCWKSVKIDKWYKRRKPDTLGNDTNSS